MRSISEVVQNENPGEELHEFKKAMLERLSFSQRLSLKLKGSTYIGDYQLRNWKGKLPFYIFECSIHGYQIGYPAGFYHKLICPICIKENEVKTQALVAF